MKTILKLTEKDIHNIVKESVMKILKESVNEKKKYTRPI